MSRVILALALASSLAAACSRSNEAQPAAGAQQAQAAPAGTQAAQSAPAAARTDQPAPGAAPAAAPAEKGPEARPATEQPQPPASPAATAGGAAPAPEPAVPPEPTFRDVTIPAGTSLAVKLLTPLASNTSKAEDPVKGTLTKRIVVSGTTAAPAGAELLGSVVDAKESGRVKGRAEIAFRFDRFIVHGKTYRIQTAPVTVQAAKDTKSDVKKGGLGAGVGAVVGGIAGGGTGAAIGAVAGGAGTVLATKGKEVQLPAGSAVNALLQDSVTVTVPVKTQEPHGPQQ